LVVTRGRRPQSTGPQRHPDRIFFASLFSSASWRSRSVGGRPIRRPKQRSARRPRVHGAAEYSSPGTPRGPCPSDRHEPTPSLGRVGAEPDARRLEAATHPSTTLSTRRPRHSYVRRAPPVTGRVHRAGPARSWSPRGVALAPAARTRGLTPGVRQRLDPGALGRARWFGTRWFQGLYFLRVRWPRSCGASTSRSLGSLRCATHVRPRAVEGHESPRLGSWRVLASLPSALGGWGDRSADPGRSRDAIEIEPGEPPLRLTSRPMRPRWRLSEQHGRPSS